ncbi:hypothetical protein ACWDYJ_03490 [Streptomyces sp. NPDC003042]
MAETLAGVRATGADDGLGRLAELLADLEDLQGPLLLDRQPSLVVLPGE